MSLYCIENAREIIHNCKKKLRNLSSALIITLLNKIGRLHNKYENIKVNENKKYTAIFAF